MARTSKTAIPDGWLKCPALGVGDSVIADRFLVLKTPLSPKFNHRLTDDEQFGFRHIKEHLEHHSLNLIGIIDLTMTSRYYDSYEAENQLGAKYIKVASDGHGAIPTAFDIRQFYIACDNIWEWDKRRTRMEMSSESSISTAQSSSSSSATLTSSSSCRSFESDDQHSLSQSVHNQSNTVSTPGTSSSFLRPPNKTTRDYKKVIAIHCTHGFNRTGYYICTFLIERLRYSPLGAIETFSRIRPPGIYRQNYLDHLFRKWSTYRQKKELSVPIAIEPEWSTSQESRKRPYYRPRRRNNKY